jgi:hypothetical protein
MSSFKRRVIGAVFAFVHAASFALMPVQTFVRIPVRHVHRK